MTLPQPVPEAALRRLRRSYALLMLLLGAPVLAAVIYVLVLQFEIVSLGAQRQIAMSTDRRVTRLDAVLAPLRDNLLFGRITYGVAGAEGRVLALVRRWLAEPKPNLRRGVARFAELLALLVRGCAPQTR